MSIQGELVTLRPVVAADLPAIVRWGKDPEIRRLMDGSLPDSAAAAAAWLNEARSSHQRQVFAIETREENRQFIGIIELDHIAWRSGQAELRVCIGEPSYWNRGYGRDAVRAFLADRFSHTRLSLIYLRVYTFNQRAVRCYRHCGFQSVGYLRRSSRSGPRSVLLMEAARSLGRATEPCAVTASRVPGAAAPDAQAQGA